MPLPAFPIGEQPTGMTAAEASIQRGNVIFLLLLLVFLDILCECEGNPIEAAALDIFALIGLAVILFANTTQCAPAANPQPGCCPCKCCAEEDAAYTKAFGSTGESDEPAQPEAQDEEGTGQ